MARIRAGSTLAPFSKFNFPQIPHIPIFCFDSVPRSLPDCFKPAETSQLLRPQIFDHLWIIHSRDTGKISLQESVTNCRRADDIRLLPEPVKAARRDKKRVISRYVTGYTVLYPVAQ